ncbi:hypothetical protein AsAng_0047680 [Aureispira anguillae]|uniref:Uncharacterized protein n=1 Tax=Aureispira anguillae TaxID=2864201 RepID=A0A916DVW1_9BACT|nr:hypothetical protein AsAng_0047680 [Aureispira anguillae]
MLFLVRYAHENSCKKAKKHCFFLYSFSYKLAQFALLMYLIDQRSNVKTEI